MRIWMLIPLLLPISLLQAEEKTPPPVQTSLVSKSIGTFFALSVANVDSASAWYRDKLGFQVIANGEAPDKTAKFAFLKSNNSIIEIVQHREARSLADAAPSVKQSFQIHGIFKIGYTVEDLDSVYQYVKERGIPIAYDMMPAKDVPMRSFIIRDIEGNFIQFFGR